MPEPEPPPHSDDLARLRARHPAWSITTAWTTRATGPDFRQFAARREGVEVRAWSAGGLSAGIAAEERAHGW
jgi:hypothetical protein